MSRRRRQEDVNQQEDADTDNTRRSCNLKVRTFDPDTDEWEYYIQYFELELKSARITTEEDRRDALLTKVGCHTFKLLVDHFRPRLVGQCSYRELLTVIDSFYSEVRSVTTDRVTFSMRKRGEAEMMKRFISDLKAQAGRCAFGISASERIRDQIIVGINNSDWQYELLKAFPGNTHTLADVEALALQLEQGLVAQRYLDKLTTIGVNRVAGVSKSKNHSTCQEHSTIVLVRGLNCLACGARKHRDSDICKALGQECHLCKGKNHFARVCLRKGRAIVKQQSMGEPKEQRRTNKLQIQTPDSSSGSESDAGSGLGCRQLSKSGTKVILNVVINHKPLRMLFDSGAYQSVISKRTWKNVGRPQLEPYPNLRAYTDLEVKTLGLTFVTVEAFGSKLDLPIIVVDKHDTPLFGLKWALEFKLPLPPGAEVCTVTNPPTAEEKLHKKEKPIDIPDIPIEIKELIKNYPSLFDDSTGTIVGHKLEVRMKPNAIPKFFKPRPVPFALQPAVEQELDRLLTEGIIEPIDPATTPIEWASPLVIAPKPNGKIRLCADFRVTINKYINMDMHPLPTFEEVSAQLAGGEHFSTIDLRDAYLQMEVEEESKKFLVISTHKGFFRYRRMPFGISSAPAKFQRTMEIILQGITGVKCYLDDIIITGKNRQEHVRVIENVINRLSKAGMRVRLEKCKWLQDTVIYLGHRFDKHGIHPTEERIESMKQLRHPTNVKELRSFLGCINYYQRFIPNLQGECAILHRLLQKGAKWIWTEEHTKKVEQLKTILTSSDTLVHYDTNTPLILYSDASETGLGAVLCHRFQGGQERPIAYSSRTLNASEKRYSVIDREALAIISAVKKFERYLYGRKFILRTDHKPLMYLFGGTVELPKVAMSRLTRWAIMLSEFDYTVEYITGKENCPADVLSRLSAQDSESTEADYGLKIAHTRLKDIAISKTLLRMRSTSDMVLRKVIRFIQEGWPRKEALGDELATYAEKKEELSYEEGIVLWKGRIVIPSSLQKDIMQILHEGHPGSAAMRSVARLHLWWPNMDKQIEAFLKTCSPCQQNRPWDPESPVYSWNVPTEVWSRIHVDFAEAFEGHSWLIVVDATSKWQEIIPMKNHTAEKTITALEEMFARFGLPRVIVSDNGPQFCSQLFKEFCDRQNIKHVTTTPYHPRTNGLAERAVRTFKQRLASSKLDGDLQARLRKYLFSYRTATHSTTKRSPAMLMLGREPRTRLSLLKPNLAAQVEEALQKQQHISSRFKEFIEGEEVWVKRRKEDKIFSKAVVKEKTGPLSYIVIVDGIERRVHADQMRKGPQPEGGEMLSLHSNTLVT